MSRADDLKVLYTAPPKDYKVITFDSIMPTCRILNVLTMQDIMQLNTIAKDKKLSSKPVEKLNMIKNIMNARGFKKLASGTNRIVFKYMEDQSFVIKVAYDSVGLGDNLREMYNQEYLKPFCTKVFDVSPCGTVGMFERVHTISNREEFASIAQDIFDIVVNNFVGQLILDDFGSKFFMNWGVRKGMHPVILDFPYVYELDGAKIYCNRPDPNSSVGFCGGEIDYDDGFNHLICKKCGKTFLASELRLAAQKKSKNIIIEREDINMIIEVRKGDHVVSRTDTTRGSDVYKKDKKGRRKETPLEYRQRRRALSLKVEVGRDIVDDNIQPDQNNTPQSNGFNTNWSLDSIPSIDKMYKDTKVVVSVPDRSANKNNKPVNMQEHNDKHKVYQDDHQEQQTSSKELEDIIATVQKTVNDNYARGFEDPLADEVADVHRPAMDAVIITPRDEVSYNTEQCNAEDQVEYDEDADYYQESEDQSETEEGSSDNDILNACM